MSNHDFEATKRDFLKITNVKNSSATLHIINFLDIL